MPPLASTRLAIAFCTLATLNFAMSELTMNCLANPSSHNNPSSRGHECCNMIETTISGFEEALVDCSQCLKIVKDARPKILAICCPEDDSECYAFRGKLRDEQERHSATRSLLEKLSLELETYKKGLEKAEKERAEALVYSAEVEALREKLSAKERELLDLYEELSQRERDLGLQDKLREGSSRGETPRKRSSRADTILPNGQSFAQEVAQVHRREDLQRERVLLDAPQRELQSLTEDANCDRVEVGEADAFETSQRELHDIDISLMPSEQMVEERWAVSPRLGADINVDNAGLQSYNYAAVCPQSDGVAIPDAIEPEQVSPQAVGQQSHDIPHLITAGPKIMPQQVGLHLEIVGDVMAGHPSDNVFVPDVEAAHQAAAPSGYFSSSNTVGQQPNDIAGPNTDGPEIVPQQVDPDLDTVGDNGSTGFVQHHTESLQLDGAVASHPSGIASVLDVNDAKAAQHEAAHQHSDADGAQVAPPLDISSSSPLDTSERYTRSNRKLIFILSTVVAFVAVAIQYELGQEMSRRSTGLIRPGWARHRKEGWKRKGHAGKFL
ncbi:hypothetical protein EDB86DRAFT_1273778 [Lactarius hatsudake]|nr:hypothetical protein EDB86DRAFT_1273778 [Lactarius hatsudake]